MKKQARNIIQTKTKTKKMRRAGPPGREYNIWTHNIINGHE